MPIYVSITLQFLQQVKKLIVQKRYFEIFHNQVVIVGSIGEIQCRMELVIETERSKLKYFVQTWANELILYRN